MSIVLDEAFALKANTNIIVKFLNSEICFAWKEYIITSKFLSSKLPPCAIFIFKASPLHEGIDVKL